MEIPRQESWDRSQEHTAKEIAKLSAGLRSADSFIVFCSSLKDSSYDETPSSDDASASTLDTYWSTVLLMLCSGKYSLIQHVSNVQHHNGKLGVSYVTVDKLQHVAKLLLLHFGRGPFFNPSLPTNSIIKL